MKRTLWLPLIGVIIAAQQTLVTVECQATSDVRVKIESVKVANVAKDANIHGEVYDPVLEGQVVTITVHRDIITTVPGTLDSTLRVNYNLEGTATVGRPDAPLDGTVDYDSAWGGNESATQRVIEFGNLSHYAVIQLNVHNDNAQEILETIKITLMPAEATLPPAAQHNYTIASTAHEITRNFTIRDNVTVSFVATDVEARERITSELQNPAVLTLKRTKALPAALKVWFQTLDATAQYGVDYTFATSTPGSVLDTSQSQDNRFSITIPANQSQCVLEIRPIDDEFVEPEEALKIAVIGTANEETWYLVSDDAFKSLKILDNEPTVGISANVSTLREGSGQTATFTVTRVGSAYGSLTIKVGLSGTATPSYSVAGKDYEVAAVTGTLTFQLPASQNTVSFTVTASYDDNVGEGAETIVAALVGPEVPARYTISSAAPSSIVVIADNEPTYGVRRVIGKDETVEGSSSPATFEVFRTGGDAVESSVRLAIDATSTATEGSDFGAVGRAVTVPANLNSVKVDVSTAGYDDALGETDETIVLKVVAGSNNEYNIDPSQNVAVLSILDNEPRIAIDAPASALTGYERNVQPATVRLVRSRKTDQETDVFFNFIVPSTKGALNGTDFNNGAGGQVVGPVHFAEGQTVATVLLHPINDQILEPDETTEIQLVADDTTAPTYGLSPGKISAVIKIQNNTPEVTVATIKQAVISEGGVGKIRFAIPEAVAYSLSVPFSLAGDAKRCPALNCNYSINGDQVLIPAGSSEAELEVTATDGTGKAVELTALPSTADPAPYRISVGNATVRITELGDVGVYADVPYTMEGEEPAKVRFSVPAVSSASRVLKYIIKGSAQATDFTLTPSGGAYETKTITLPAGAEEVTLSIQANPDTDIEPCTDVVIELQKSENYGVDPLHSFVRVYIADPDVVGGEDANYIPQRRYFRGDGCDPAFMSFVLPLDLVAGGARLPFLGDTFGAPEGGHWISKLNRSTSYHYSARSNTWMIAAENPIVAFGTKLGGPPVYANRRYEFGIYGGALWGGSIKIGVYDRRQLEVAGTRTMPMPVTGLVVPTPNTPAWDSFAAADFTMTWTITVTGTDVTVTNTLRLRQDSLSGLPEDSLFVLSHWASSEHACLIVTTTGRGDGARWLSGTVDSDTAPGAGDPPENFTAETPLYALEFQKPSSSSAQFLSGLHFNSQPMPSSYIGRSPEELSRPRTQLPEVGASKFTTAFAALTETQPELRPHDVLDGFVSSLNRDPMALANYVQNEVELVDGIDLSEMMATGSVWPGGIARSALGVFEQGQGSPWEQCALLIYFLRKCDIKAGYALPVADGIKMLPTEVSRMLQVQVKGALSSRGEEALPQLIAVNYPWVVAQIDGTTRHFFPWLKDIEILEGFDVYDFVDHRFNSAFKWSQAYLSRNPDAFPAGGASKPPLEAFEDFIVSQSRAKGLSLDDFGVRARIRKHLYSRWQDFPRPMEIAGASQVIGNLVASKPKLFDTVQVIISRTNVITEDTGQILNSGEIFSVDLHNRPLSFRNIGFQQTKLRLEPLQHNDSRTPGSFPIENKVADGARAFEEVAYTKGPHQTPDGNDRILVKVVRRRLRDVPSNFLSVGQRDSDQNPWEISSSDPVNHTAAEHVDEFRSDIAGSLCFSEGAVTQKMTERQYREMNELLLKGDLGDWRARTLYLLPSTWFQLGGAHSRGLDRYHKTRRIRTFGYAFGVLERSGVVHSYVYRPGVHASYVEETSIFSGNSRPDIGFDVFSADRNVLGALVLSSAEHQAVDAVFGRTNSVSTVRLLRAASSQVSLTKNNWQTEAQVLQNGNQPIWNRISEFMTNGSHSRGIITPGNVQIEEYQGAGALMFDEFASAAWISGALGGGSGTFALPEKFTLRVVQRPDGTYVLDTGFQQFTFTSFAPDQTTALNWSQTAPTDPFFTSMGERFKTSFGYPPGATLAQILGYSLEEWPISTDERFPTRSTYLADPVNIMSGGFFLDHVDLELPGPIPFQIRRNYSSLNMAHGAFGYGWNLSYVPYITRIGTDLIQAGEMNGAVLIYRRIPGQDVWQALADDNSHVSENIEAGVGAGNPFNTRIIKSAGAEELYTIYAPDGSKREFVVRQFDLGGITRQQPMIRLWEDNRGNSLHFEVDPANGNLIKVSSTNGNVLLFSYDRVGRIIEARTKDGRAVSYAYDPVFGDLTEVTLPDGATTRYEYEKRTWMVNGVETLYPTHLLLREIKPDGRELVNEYHQSARFGRSVWKQYATVGNDLKPVLNATFTYDHGVEDDVPMTDVKELTGVTTAKDANDGVSTYEYSGGKVFKTTDAIGQVSERKWYENTDTGVGAYKGRLQELTDHRGLLTTWTYDARGNVKSIRRRGDLIGDTDGVPIEELGLLGQTDIDSDGDGTQEDEVTVNVFEVFAKGSVSFDRLKKIFHPNGTVSRLFYEDTSEWPMLPVRMEVCAADTDNAEDLITATKWDYTDVSDLVNAQQVAAFGLLFRSTAAVGTEDEAVSETAYDARGYPTAISRFPSSNIASRDRFQGNLDPPIVTTMLYNERGEVARTSDSGGAGVAFDYDPMGRKTHRETFHANGLRLAGEYWYYNLNGEVEWYDGPQRNPDDYVWADYDGAGRQIYRAVWRSRGTAGRDGVEACTDENLLAAYRFEYDAFGNLLTETDPRGNATTRTYDAIGRVKIETLRDPSGNPVLYKAFRYLRGDLERVYSQRYPSLTEEERFTFYNSRGQRRKEIRADGTVYEWRYYVDGRLKCEYLPNGTRWETSYDFRARQTERVLRSASGLVLATAREEYDRRGNLVKVTDVDSYTTTTVHDDLDRVKSVSGPPAVAGTAGSDQQTVTFTYDATGRVVKRRNALGEESTTTRDALERPTLVTVTEPSSTLPVRYTRYVYSTDQHSVAVLDGLGVDTKYTTNIFDHAGRLVVRRSRVSATESVGTRFVYDQVGNITIEQDELGLQTEYRYNALNLPVEILLPDGTSTTFAYDSELLVRRNMPGGLTWQGDYDYARRITRESVECSGVARVTEYKYYDSGPWHGLLESVWYPDSFTSLLPKTFEYDEFSRVRQYDGPGDYHVYLNRDRRGNVVGGQRVSDQASTLYEIWSRTIDGYGQLLSETISIYSPDTLTPFVYDATHGAVQRWDAAGRRSALTLLKGEQSMATYRFGYRADGRMTSVIDPQGVQYSFVYDRTGDLLSRENPSRKWSVVLRDGLGRHLETRNVVAGIAHTETASWRPDSKLLSYKRSTEPTASYEYSERGQLKKEQVSLSTSSVLEATYSFDQGVERGLGIRTSSSYSPSGASWSVGASGMGGLATIVQESTDIFRRFSVGESPNARTVSALLDQKAMENLVFPVAEGGKWHAYMEVIGTGQHELRTVAEMPNGTSISKTHTFNVSSGNPDNLLTEFDEEGKMVKRRRQWSDNGTTREFEQTMGWDDEDRLQSVRQEDFNGDGYHWFALYDHAGRRVQTTQFPVIGGVPVYNKAIMLESWYDPEVEFLELALQKSRSAENLYQTPVPLQISLKVYGPDLNGQYGGLQGIGGLEAIIETDSSGSTVTRLLSDAFGNVTATLSPLSWKTLRVTSYGPVPGSCVPFVTETTSLADATLWKGKRVDPTAFYYFGARYFDPLTGRFLSPDPAGHAGSMDLYSYANGDPINFADPDGRLGKRWADYSHRIDINNPLDFLQAIGYGIGGTALQTVGSIPGMFDDAGAGMAAARQEIYGYEGRQAFLARSLMLPADIAFGTTRLFNDPFNTVADMPQGFVNFGGKIGTDIYNVGENPSINTVFNIAEDAIGIWGIASGTTRGLTASGVTAPVENFAARTYLQATKGGQWKQYYNSFAPGTARLKVGLGGLTLFRAANSEGAAAFGEFASVERPSSPAAAIRGSALDPAITRNRASQLFQVTTRAGFSIEGIVAPQSAGYPGGFTQVFQTSRNSIPTWNSVQRVSYSGGTP